MHCRNGLAHLNILIHEFLNKDTDIFPEETPPIILDRKSSMFIDNNGKDTNHTRYIAKIVHL